MIPRSRSIAFLVVLGTLLAFLASSCIELHDWKRLERPWTDADVAREKDVRVVRVDQPSLTLRRARIETPSEGTRIVGFDVDDARAELAIPLERVSALEVRRIAPGRVAVVVIVVALVVTGIVTLGAESQIGTFY